VHNVQPYEFEITYAKSSKPPRMFQCDVVDTSPNLGGKNVLKTVEMAIWHKKADDINGIRVFCHWIYFHLRSKIFYGPLRGRSPPSVTDWDLSRSKSHTRWQYPAVQSTSSRLPSSTLCGSLRKTRFHAGPSVNKSELQSRSASGRPTFPLKLIAKTIRYQDPSFPAWNGDCFSSVSTSVRPTEK